MRQAHRRGGGVASRERPPSGPSLPPPREHERAGLRRPSAYARRRRSRRAYGRCGPGEWRRTSSEGSPTCVATATGCGAGFGLSRASGRLSCVAAGRRQRRSALAFRQTASRKGHMHETRALLAVFQKQNNRAPAGLGNPVDPSFLWHLLLHHNQEIL